MQKPGAFLAAREMWLSRTGMRAPKDRLNPRHRPASLVPSAIASVSTTAEEDTVRVLIAEDDPVTLRLVQTQLTKWGYEVIACANGVEAWDLLKTDNPPKLLVLDWMMPELDGLSLCRRIRNVERQSYIYIILLTARGRKEDLIEGLEAGADDYVVKPFDPSELSVRIRGGQRIVELQEELIGLKADLERSNAELHGEVEERLKAEQALQRAHDDLEKRVQDRTAELVRKNEQLEREIAERERLEQTLRASEERFRVLFESANDWIFVKDRALRYTHANPAMLKFLDLPLDKVAGKTDEEIFSPQEARLSREVEYRVLAGQTVELEHSVRFRGTAMTWHFVRVPLRDTQGRIDALCGIARDVTDRRQTHDELEPSWEGGPSDHYPSVAMQRTLEQVLTAARTDSICLFLGESGSGKDYLARVLHDHSPRASGPIFTINCAALAPELAESELFGHEAGAFTGSSGRKRGLLELAEGGTLLLNEIGELSTRLQAKLLTFLDTQTFTRVGGERNITVNARLVAATNRNLEQDVERGNFRKDLFYRLSVIVIVVPPLRDRVDDLPLLIESITESLAKRLGLRKVPKVDHEAMAVLAGYNWPGNIRELRNVLERALIHSGDGIITADRIALDSFVSVPETKPGITYRLTVPEGESMNEAIAQAKRYLVQEGLRRSGGNVKQAARLLGLSRDALNYLIRTLPVVRD